jgi:hypothetical protein
MLCPLQVATGGKILKAGGLRAKYRKQERCSPSISFLLNRKALGDDPRAFCFNHYIQYNRLELTKFKLDVYAT